MRSALMDAPAAAHRPEAPGVATMPLRSEKPGPQGPKPEPLGEGLTPRMLALLLEKIANFKPESQEALFPALRILALALVAGIGIRITAGVLEAINGVPALGRLLQLVGLVAALQFLSRHALKQRQRAELLVRIEKLKADFLG